MTGLEQLAVQMEQNRAMQRAVEKSTPIAYEEKVAVPSLTDRIARMGYKLLVAASEIGTPDLHAGGVPEYKLPKNSVLKKMMKQPCEDTLAGVDYIKVDDGNYKAEVFQHDVPEKDRKPVMVLFYNNNGKSSSTGNAALARVLKDKYNDKIKLCAYKLSDGSKTPDSVQNWVNSKYPVEKTPALLLYDTNKGSVNYNERLNGGIRGVTLLKKNIKIFMKYMDKNLF